MRNKNNRFIFRLCATFYENLFRFFRGSLLRFLLYLFYKTRFTSLKSRIFGNFGTVQHFRKQNVFRKKSQYRVFVILKVMKKSFLEPEWSPLEIFCCNSIRKMSWSHRAFLSDIVSANQLQRFFKSKTAFIVYILKKYILTPLRFVRTETISDLQLFLSMYGTLNQPSKTTRTDFLTTPRACSFLSPIFE